MLLPQCQVFCKLLSCPAYLWKQATDAPEEFSQVFENPGIVLQAQSHLTWEIKFAKHLGSLADEVFLCRVLQREMMQEAVSCLGLNLSGRFSYPKGGSAKLGIYMKVFLQNLPGSSPWRVLFSKVTHLGKWQSREHLSASSGPIFLPCVLSFLPKVPTRAFSQLWLLFLYGPGDPSCLLMTECLLLHAALLKDNAVFEDARSPMEN